MWRISVNLSRMEVVDPAQSQYSQIVQPYLAWASPQRAVTSVYLHVPFCAVKCHYCAFYSKEPDRQTIEDYVSSLCLEIQRAGDYAFPSTIFFGGGTPSLLPAHQLQRIFQTLETVQWTQAREWTIECNPATLNPDKIALFRQYGVNRISMGVQSLEPDLLERLGRIHSVDMVHRSFDQLRQAGFDNINLDLMFAIPGQTMEMWNSTLEKILSFGSEHLSCYEVIYEEDTPLFESLKSGEFTLDEDAAESMYLLLIDKLSAAGFRQYEVANFARDHRLGSPSTLPPTPDGFTPKLACQHNLNYWRGGAYLGLGPSANGYVRGIRYQNVANTQRYIELIQSQPNAIEWQEKLSPLARAGELAAFGFRSCEGWHLNDFKSITGMDMLTIWSQEIEKLQSWGWMKADGDRLFLTPLGLRFADAVAMEFVQPTEN